MSWERLGLCRRLWGCVVAGESREFRGKELLRDSGRVLRCAVPPAFPAALKDRLLLGKSLAGRW